MGALEALPMPLTERPGSGAFTAFTLNHWPAGAAEFGSATKTTRESYPFTALLVSVVLAAVLPPVRSAEYVRLYGSPSGPPVWKLLTPESSQPSRPILVSALFQYLLTSGRL